MFMISGKLRVFFVNEILAQCIDALLGPIFVIYLLNSGISHAQLGSLMALYYFILAVLVVVTGSMADAWSRRKSAMLGNLLYTIAYLLMFFASTYSHFLVAVALMGVASSFISRPLNAWIMDEVKRSYGERQWVRYTSKMMKLGEASFIFASLIAFVFLFRAGGFEGNVTHLLRYFWIVAAILDVFILLNLLFSEEAPLRKKEKSAIKLIRKTLTNFKQFIELIRSSTTLKYLTASMVVWSIGYGMLFIGFFPYVKDVLGIKEQFFNLIFLSSSALAIMIYHYNEHLVKMFGSERNAIIATEVFAVLLILLLFFISHPLVSIALLILLMSVETGTEPIFSSLLNRPIPSKIRSTTLSFITVPTMLAGTVASLIYGAITELHGLHAVIVVVLACVVIGLGLLIKVEE